ncbi:MAG: cell envelope integrity protein CreD [Jannaschia sp.]
MRSAGFRYLVVALLTLLMSIPLFFAGAIVQDRSSYAEQTRREVGRDWGGPQTLTGPYLVIPVEGSVLRAASRRGVSAQDDQGPVPVEPATATILERGPVAPILLLPETLTVDASTATEIRTRGIFDVPVYAADVAISATFDTGRIGATVQPDERVQWDRATIHLGITGNAGLRGEAVVTGPGGALDLEPVADQYGEGGILAPIGDPTGRTAFDAAFRLNGAQEFMVVPAGRDTNVTLRGDWPDPGFVGAFLPDSREVTETGHSARWTIPHLARALPQVLRASRLQAPEQAFGVAFVQVNDFYQKAWRAARYGILFIALTFLTVLLIERPGRPTHPVQYLLIGLAQSIFVLLMVAYAERIGFRMAYLWSAAATIALLTLFGWIGLKLGWRTLVLGAFLIALYAVLYLILISTDFALIAGATLAFAALTLTVIATRNEDWYGPDGPGRGLRSRSQPKAAASAISTMSPKED